MKYENAAQAGEICGKIATVEENLRLLCENTSSISFNSKSGFRNITIELNTSVDSPESLREKGHQFLSDIVKIMDNQIIDLKTQLEKL